MKINQPAIEALEPRIVPAAVFTYADVDGDFVTIRTSRGTDAQLAAILDLAPSGLGMELQEIDFSANAAVFAGTNLTVSAARTSAGGDGRVNVGYIDAAGGGDGIPLDLGAIVIKGDLGRIDAGLAFAEGSAIRGLTVQSMGEFGLSTQGAGGSLESNLSGRLDFLKVAGNIREAFIDVVGTGASIGPVTVGGSIIGGTVNDSGSIASEGPVGTLKIGGDLRGGAGQDSGSILAPEGIASITIGGSMVGGDGSGSGSIASLAGSIGKVKIGGNLAGADGDVTGRIAATVSIGRITIGGSVLGGAGSNSGGIVGGGSITSLKVAGDIEGTGNTGTGFIITTGTLGKVSIGGSIIGGSTTGGDFFSSGLVAAGAQMGPVKILGNIAGGSISGIGSLDNAGVIRAGRLTSLSVGGSIIAGFESGGGTLTNSGAIRVANDIGTMVIKGSLVGNATEHVLITARGQLSPGPASDVAIKSLTVGGRVERAQILAGYDTLETPAALNADAQIGAVTVGDWIASDLIAGAASGNGSFGDGDDTLIPEIDESPGIQSRIASIVIKGTALGTISGGDHYGFVAERIGLLKIGGTKLPLLAGASTDLAGLAVGITNDLRVREIGP